MREYNLAMRDAGVRRFDIGVDANRFFPVAAEDVVAFFAAAG